MNLNRQQLLPAAAFILLVIASVYLNFHLFKSLSTVIHTRWVFATIGVALDLTKAGAISLAMGRGAFSVTERMLMGLLFTAVSILASAAMINASFAATTGDIATSVDSLSVVEEQIETQQDYIATLQERLKGLPAEWPRNREQVIGHIREARTDLDALTDERTELLSSQQSNEPEQMTGQFIYDMAELLEISAVRVRMFVSWIIAILIDTAIWFTAWQVREKSDRSRKTEEQKRRRWFAGKFRKNRVIDDDNDRQQKLRYVMAAYPAKPREHLKSLKKVADEHDISRYQSQKIHAELKTAGFIRVEGNRSYSTAPKADVIDWLNQESA